MAIVYLCLGSNTGDRVGYLQQATMLIKELEGTSVIRTSSFYETQPWLEVDTTWYVNAVLEIKTPLSPLELLEGLNRIENQLGRNREAERHHGDRTLDIDILFYNDEIIKEQNLEIPHKFIHQRAFTLVPMLEINPDFVHPDLGKSIEQLHDELENPEIVLLYGTRSV